VLEALAFPDLTRPVWGSVAGVLCIHGGRVGAVLAVINLTPNAHGVGLGGRGRQAVRARRVAPPRLAGAARLCIHGGRVGAMLVVEGVPREQKMLKGHLPRVIYHQAYKYTKINLSPNAGILGVGGRVRQAVHTRRPCWGRVGSNKPLS